MKNMEIRKILASILIGIALTKGCEFTQKTYQRCSRESAIEEQMNSRGLDTKFVSWSNRLESIGERGTHITIGYSDLRFESEGTNYLVSVRDGSWSEGAGRFADQLSVGKNVRFGYNGHYTINELSENNYKIKSINGYNMANNCWVVDNKSITN